MPIPSEKHGGENGEEEDYEVEDIIDHKYMGKRMKKLYLIRWKGYSSESDTWEPEVCCASCPEIVEKYLEAHPDERPANLLPKPKKTPKPKKEKIPEDIVPRDTPKRAAANVSFAESTDNADYEVGAIVSHKIIDEENHYLVQWKGFSTSQNSWEPESSLSCAELIEKFHKRPLAKKGKGKGRPPKDNTKLKGKVGKKVNKPPKDDYEVEKIINSKLEKGKKVFLIRWKGYTAKDDTWEPLASLNCPELIKAFEKNQNGGKGGKGGKGGRGGKGAKGGKGKNQKVVDDDEDDENENEPDYEVEKIIEEKTERGKKMYLVKWKGYSHSDNTWEPESSLSCPDLVAAYKKSVKASPVTNGKKTVGRKRKAVEESPAKSTPKRGRKSVTYADEEHNKDTESEDDQANDDEKEWEVEKIVNERTNKQGETEYLIRWKGCKPSSDTWEPESQLNCPEIIAKFEKSESAGRRGKAKKSSKRAWKHCQHSTACIRTIH